MAERIFMNFSEEVGLQDVPFNPLNTGIFSHFFGEIHDSKQHCRKTVEQIFMKFSEKDGLDTRSNLEHFWDVTFNPLNPGSIYLFPGSVFVCNIMEKRVNGFSWNFYEKSGKTQEIIS